MPPLQNHDPQMKPNATVLSLGLHGFIRSWRKHDRYRFVNTFSKFLKHPTIMAEIHDKQIIMHNEFLWKVSLSMQRIVRDDVFKWKLQIYRALTAPDENNGFDVVYWLQLQYIVCKNYSNLFIFFLSLNVNMSALNFNAVEGYRYC